MSFKQLKETWIDYKNQGWWTKNWQHCKIFSENKRKFGNCKYVYILAKTSPVIWGFRLKGAKWWNN